MAEPTERQRQSSTVVTSGDGKRGGASASVLAPILDSTPVPALARKLAPWLSR